ncbi:neurotrypsin-like, partial [Nerophis ophidion]|uniref:neurotrypsin-like n=1 Tax=Nerophis ophidion TaxID=159077 RepID=UPI002ADFCFFF
GSTRLVGGAKSLQGRLEVFYHGQWGTVCDDGWTDANTQVVCRQLGYRSGQTLVPEGRDISPNPRFGVASGPILLDEVSCTGKEPGLLLCRRKEWFSHDCTHHQDVNIACNPERLGDGITASVPMRLVGGETLREGRVELYLSGQWGTVCDDGWTDQDAEVVCRQMGYSGVAKARVMAYFGEGTGPIHLDNVECGGHERAIADCIKQQAPVTHNCRHSEDAGVICDYGYKEVKDPVRPLCGVRLVHPRRRRIIGGENSLRGGWPWQAAIRLRGSPGDGRLVCGATLIDSCWVLTSAHCFKKYGNASKQYKVRVGDYHSLVPEEYEEEHAVHHIVLHPNYRSASSDYDLALVRLAVRAEAAGACVAFSPHVLPACLPLRKERALKGGSNCHISGWGDTGETHSNIKHHNCHISGWGDTGETHSNIKHHNCHHISGWGDTGETHNNIKHHNCHISGWGDTGETHSNIKHHNCHHISGWGDTGETHSNIKHHNCHISGWGDTGRAYSKTLQQAALSLLPRRHCQQRFQAAFTSRMLCAGSVQEDRRVDSCRGDSGGPLVCERPGGGWVVYGVTSWGHACRTQRSPGVYTKVSAFSSWIHKVIGRHAAKYGRP